MMATYLIGNIDVVSDEEWAVEGRIVRVHDNDIDRARIPCVEGPCNDIARILHPIGNTSLDDAKQSSGNAYQKDVGEGPVMVMVAAMRDVRRLDHSCKANAVPKAEAGRSARAATAKRIVNGVETGESEPGSEGES